MIRIPRVDKDAGGRIMFIIYSCKTKHLLLSSSCLQMMSESSSKKPKANNTEPNKGNSVIFLNDAATKIPSIGGFMDTQPTCEQHIVSKSCDSAPGNGEKDVYTPNTSNANATDTAYLCAVDTGFAPSNVEKDVYTPNNANGNVTDTAYLCAANTSANESILVNRYGSAISTNDRSSVVEDVITELSDNTCINDDPTRCTASDNANNICGLFNAYTTKYKNHYPIQKNDY
ncbi:hypothetical protein Tco_0458243 [Tanacetum coccineum]